MAQISPGQASRKESQDLQKVPCASYYIIIGYIYIYWGYVGVILLSNVFLVVEPSKLRRCRIKITLARFAAQSVAAVLKQSEFKGLGFGVRGLGF